MRDSVKGQLDFMLLSVLRGGPAHGYVIIEEIRRRSGGMFDLPESTIYPALHRMDAEGLLVSEWAEVNGRRRRVYQLTSRGEAALANHVEAWRRFSDAVSAVGEVR